MLPDSLSLPASPYPARLLLSSAGNTSEGGHIASAKKCCSICSGACLACSTPMVTFAYCGKGQVSAEMRIFLSVVNATVFGRTLLVRSRVGIMHQHISSPLQVHPAQSFQASSPRALTRCAQTNEP